jgi:predicted nuclease of predicted toxin-antitoxin system
VRWLADECVAAPLVAWLRGAGHDVLYVAEAAAGLSDADVIALALRENRLLLTEDKDFGDPRRKASRTRSSFRASSSDMVGDRLSSL